MKYSYAQAKEIIATYVAENKIANPTFNATKDNLVGLTDKVGLIVTFDTSFQDKLAMFNGEDLPFGKTIEEWQQDLILPEDFDPTGAGALSPHFPTYRPVSWSYTLGRKKLPLSIKNDDIERAVNSASEFASISAMTTKRLQDSYAEFVYGLKREALAKLIAKCDAPVEDATTFSASTTYAVGSFVKSGSPSEYGVVVKPITGSASETSTWKKCKDGGYVVLYDLVKEIAAPSDTSSGEAFVKQVKKDVEVASDISEGHSINGNTLGAVEGLVLIVKQGIIPEIEVEVLAGAFHSDKVMLPAEVITIKDFGSDDTGVYAMLVDKRIMRLHNSYRAIRENLNGDGDFLNLFQHTEDTVHISNNCFVRVYRPA